MSNRSANERERREAAQRLAAMVGSAAPPARQPSSPMGQPTHAPAQPTGPAIATTTWEVRGAFRDSGKEAMLIISAPTQAAAEHEAVQHGLLVESCWPATTSASTAPLHAHTLGYATPVPPPGMPFGPPQFMPVVIEQTSKRYKWQMLAGFLLSVFGLLTGCLSAPMATAIAPPLGVLALVVGGMCFVGGFLWASIAKFGAWWHHG